MRLLIANKNYSSWSLRPWLLLKQLGIPFEEDKLSYNDPDFKARIRAVSPAGKVPVLVDGDLVVWDSLAIVEYLAERFPDRGVWPAAPAARARARSVCAEMHSGFEALRSRLGMNCELHLPMAVLDLATRRDIARICDIWADCAHFASGGGGPFLFGAFSAPDAYFAPVVRRFITYDVGLPEAACRYVATIDALPSMREWVAAARAENDFYPGNEPFRDHPADDPSAFYESLSEELSDEIDPPAGWCVCPSMRKSPRSVLRFRALVLGIPGITAALGVLGAASASPPAAPPRPVSPTQVLAKAAAAGSRGEAYLATGPADSTDVDAAADRSLAPYLYVAGGDPDTERLPLRETTAHVDVAGVIAHVAVHQVFENAGGKPIEAIYVFPASTRAAVHGMRMKIGQRVVEARIDRRQAARESYEAARAQGKRASLLEQERPNVFTMNVANIMPGDRIEVQLDYSELLVPEDATYEFVFPTVVGPRYTGGADPAKDQWMANPHLPAGAPSPTRFGIDVHLETGVALKELTSPSHAIDVAYASPERTVADVKLRDASGGNRDFVLRYRLAGDKIESGLLLSPRGSDGQGYFTLMMEPPRRPKLEQIPSREYIFLLDVSGSMFGFPLDTAKALMRNLLGQLRPTDHFDVALFSGANYVMSPTGSVPASAANVRDAIALVERQRGGGGTELMGGLRASYAIPRADRAVSRTVVVVTDGYVGVEAEAFRFVREHLDEANLFAFGIGTSVNRALIEGLARAGRGEPFVVLKPAKAAAEAERLRAMIEQPVLTHVGVAFEGFHTTEVSPAKLPDLLARRPIVLFGKYQGDPGGQVRVTGYAGGAAPFTQLLPVHAADARPRNEALRWLWARSWVATLEDERAMGGGQPVEDAITDLGLAYSLLTPFTSFVAVDQEIVNRTGQTTPVRQPLPMPAGVSNLAVAPAAPMSALKSMRSGMGALGGAASATHGQALAKRSYAPAEELDLEPAPPPAPTRADGSAVDKREAKAKDDERRKSPAAPHLVVVSTTPTDLASPEQLRAAIEARLAKLTWPAPWAPPGVVVLRLHVDAHGKVTAVELVSGDVGLGATLRAKLVGLTSGARGASPKATLVLTVRISN